MDTKQQERPDGQGALPLQGVRIIDFSRLLPGPWATQMLGEMGADVIKVEPPGPGDPSRYNHPAYRQHGVYFNAVNAHKRSICLDLSGDEGRAVARDLLRQADVVVETFRPGVARKLSIDYEAIRGYNAGVVYCSISGFGRTGPLSHIAGHDLVIQGMTGLMGCALEQANPPPVPGFQAADYAGALLAVIGIQAALARRAATGLGCDLDLSMYEALFQMCMIPLSSVMARSAGHAGEPRMESFGGNPRYSTYLSKDGKPVAVTLLETKSWSEFCRIANRPDLVSEDESLHARLSTHGGKSEQYRQALADYCAAHTWDELMQQMQDTGIAICPVCTPEQALALPHIAARGMVDTVHHPVEGDIPRLANPLERAGLASKAYRPAPGLGEHADAILAELGYDTGRISALRNSGII